MIWPVLIFVALLVLPGALLGWAGGLRAGWALASGPAVTFAVAGLAGWLLGAVDVGYSLITAALVWLALILVALVWRRFAPARVPAAPAATAETPDSADASAAGRDVGERPSESGNRKNRALVALPAIGGVLAAFVTLAWAALSRIERVPHQLESVQQSWDVHWHASVIRYILDTGMASSTRMGEIQNYETREPMYYPAAWHGLGALYADISGQSVAATVNILGLVAPALLIPLGAAALAWRIIDRADWTSSIAAGLAAVLTTAVPVLMPIGVYVGAWPYLLGLAMTGIAFAVLTSVPHARVRIFGAALVLIGLGQLHPSAVPATLLIVFAWWIAGRVWRPARPELGAVRSRLRDVGLLAAAGIAAAVFLVPQWLSASSQAEDIRTETATVDVDRFHAWYRAVNMLTRHAEAFGTVWAVVIPGLIGLLLVLVLLRRPWPLLAWALSVVFTAHALNPFGLPGTGILDLYNDLHYATPHRLILTTALLTTAAGGAGITLLLGLPGYLRARKGAGSSAATRSPLADDAPSGSARPASSTVPEGSAAPASGSTANVPEGSARAAAGSTANRTEKGSTRTAARVPVVQLLIAAALVAGFIPFAVHRMAPVNDFTYLDVRDGRVISERDLRAFEWLAQQPEAMEHRVFTNPNEGSAWMYPLEEIPTVFRHFVWPDADRYSATSMVYWHADKIGWGQPWLDESANDVDVALRDLDVSFIYVSPPYFWEDQRINQRFLEGIWWARGLTPVYRDEEVVIYAVNWMVDAERIEEMRAQSPEDMPPMVTRGEAGLASPGDDDYDDPYAHLPDFDLHGIGPEDPVPTN